MKPEPQDRPKPNLKAEGGWERSFRFSVFSVQPGSKERTRHFTLSALRSVPVPPFILYTSSFILLPSVACLGFCP